MLLTTPKKSLSSLSYCRNRWFPDTGENSSRSCTQLTEIPGVGNLMFFKAGDVQYFLKILKEEDETELMVEEMKEWKTMQLLLKWRQIMDKAREFGVGPLFGKILLLLIEPMSIKFLLSLSLFLSMTMHIISNLSKAASLAHMISTMCPDINHADECVWNTTDHAFSIVTSVLGIPFLLPFLKAVCRSKRSWQACSNQHSNCATNRYNDGICCST